jgi:predicted DNA-binding transcriptional regulator AlpA
MNGYSTPEAAKKLGISLITLKRYIAAKKFPVPPISRVGGMRVRPWKTEDIERVRKILPKIKNGRKTRYKKKASKSGKKK